MALEETGMDEQMRMSGECRCEPGYSSRLVVFNDAVFLARLMDDELLARSICSGFFQEMPRLITSLTEDLAAGKRDQVLRGAHRIAGAAANVGGDELRAVANLLEAVLENHDFTAGQGLVMRLDACYERLHHAMMARFFSN